MPDFDAIVRVVQLLIECGVDEQVKQPTLVEVRSINKIKPLIHCNI